MNRIYYALDFDLTNIYLYYLQRQIFSEMNLIKNSNFLDTIDIAVCLYYELPFNDTVTMFA